jgi:acyl-CoA thioesterase-1
MTQRVQQMDRREFPAKAPLRAAALLAFLFAMALPAFAAPVTIVAIGASNTSGFGVGEQNAYPAILETLLRKRGIDARVINAGVAGDVTAGMLRRLDAAIPNGTALVILQPGGNDRRFFHTAEERRANVAAMVARVKARGIRVIVYDPDPVPPDFYQWDGIHFNAAAHAKIAATLAPQVAAALAPHAAPKPPAAPAAASGPSPAPAPSVAPAAAPASAPAPSPQAAPAQAAPGKS